MNLKNVMANNFLGTALAAGYFLGDFISFIYLTFLDGYSYNWWNWIVAVPVNIFLSTIWPAYWLILRPFLG